MKIDFLVNDGSPQFVTEKTIWGDMIQPGVGGAELALLTMCAGLKSRGHNVVLYNDPREPGASSFEQRPIREFRPKDKRDILIVFRSPNIRSLNAVGRKIWWSCDQRTTGDFASFSKTVDEIVTISQYHSDYFAQMYGIEKTIITDLPVRDADYCGLIENPPERVPNRLIFSSVPDRGLNNLWRMWPMIKQLIPDASLVVTSDYRLWGGSASNEGHRMRWAARDGIIFLGAVSRQRLLEEQMKADICLYPGSYPELFCIAVAELQYAGVPCITSNIGALATTNMGTIVPVDAGNAHNDKLFMDALMDQINDPNRELRRKALQQSAAQRFSLDTILDYWEANILKG